MPDRNPNFLRFTRPATALFLALNVAACKVVEPLEDGPCQSPLTHSQPIGPNLAGNFPERYQFEDDFMSGEIELPFGICDPADGKLTSVLNSGALIQPQGNRFNKILPNFEIMTTFDVKYISEKRSLTGWSLISQQKEKPLTWYWDLKGVNFNQTHTLSVEWRNWAVRTQTIDGVPYKTPVRQIIK